MTPDESCYDVDENGCWIWNRGKQGAGYGWFSLEGKHHLAHRWFYTQLNGEISKGLFACHTCDVRSCVNPDHIFIGRHRDNMRDMSNKKRSAGHRHPEKTRGESNGRARLTEKEVRKFHKLWRAGISIATISKAYRLPSSTVHSALKVNWPKVREEVWGHG